MSSDPRDTKSSARRRRYYRSLNERNLSSDPSLRPSGEFSPEAANPVELPANGVSRLRFLGLVSASAALALGPSCSKIDRGTIIPYSRKPEEIIPGVATYYASTFQEGLVTQGVLVKTREGRPILVEGNAEHSLSRASRGR